MEKLNLVVNNDSEQKLNALLFNADLCGVGSVENELYDEYQYVSKVLCYNVEEKAIESKNDIKEALVQIINHNFEINVLKKLNDNEELLDKIIECFL